LDVSALTASSVAAHFQPRTTRKPPILIFCVFRGSPVFPPPEHAAPDGAEKHFELRFYKYGAPTVLNCGVQFFCYFAANNVFN
jgi:hypothetical protein